MGKCWKLFNLENISAIYLRQAILLTKKRWYPDILSAGKGTRQIEMYISSSLTNYRKKYKLKTVNVMNCIWKYSMNVKIYWQKKKKKHVWGLHRAAGYTNDRLQREERLIFSPTLLRSQSSIGGKPSTSPLPPPPTFTQPFGPDTVLSISFLLYFPVKQLCYPLSIHLTTSSTHPYSTISQLRNLSNSSQYP